MVELDNLRTSTMNIGNSFGANAYPINSSVYTSNSGLTPNTANPNDRLIVKPTNSPHAVINAKSPEAIRIANVSSLVRQYAHA